MGEAAGAKGFHFVFVTSRMYSALALEVGHWVETVLSDLHRASLGSTSPAHTPRASASALLSELCISNPSLSWVLGSEEQIGAVHLAQWNSPVCVEQGGTVAGREVAGVR